MYLDDKLTIIIPTHNRHNYLDRLLEYFKDINLKILIADSTNEKYDGFIDSNVSYYHYPNYELIVKFNDIVQKVKTKYLVFCADDDFLIKNSLVKCIEFLDSNLDFSSVQGRYINFYKYNNEYKFIPSYLHAKNLNIIDEDIESRLYGIMNNYMPLFYAVHRREHIQEVYKNSVDNNLHNPILFELIVALYSLIEGKYKTLDIAFYARDSISIPSTVDRTTLHKIVENSNYKEQLDIFIFTLIEYMKSKGFSEKTSKNILHKAIDIYILKHSSKKIFLMEMRIVFRKLFPNFINNMISEYMKEKKRKKIVSKMKKLDENGYPVVDKISIKQWKEIKSILEKYDI